MPSKRISKRVVDGIRATGAEQTIWDDALTRIMQRRLADVAQIIDLA